MDQSALLVALLRASGFNAGYATLWNLVHYESSDPSMPTAITWLGLAPTPQNAYQGDPPAGWSQLETQQTLLLQGFFESRGFEVVLIDQPGTILAKRTVVTAEIGSNTTLLDPSAKARESATPMDVLAATEFDKPDFLTTMGGNQGTHYISALDESEIQSGLSDMAENLRDELRASRPNDTVDQLLGIGPLFVLTLSSPDQDLVFLPYSTIAPYEPSYSETLPETAMSSLEIQVNATTAEQIHMPELAGQRLSISHDANTVRFWMEDTQLFTRSVSAATYDVTLRAIHPRSGQGTPLHDDDITNTYKKDDNFAYAIIYAFTPGQRFLRHRNE